MDIVILLKNYGLVIVALGFASFGAYLNRVQNETERGFKYLLIGIGLWVAWIIISYL